MSARLSSYRLPWNGDGWEPWLRALDGRSGVYVIRDRASGATLYVGESHTGSLYDTITRHFQRWRGRTAGTRYDRMTVLVAVETTRADRAMDRQNDLIRRMRPRDNEVGNPAAERQKRRVEFFWSLRRSLPDLPF